MVAAIEHLEVDGWQTEATNPRVKPVPFIDRSMTRAAMVPRPMTFHPD
jgi:hypothetical protein